MKAAVSVSADAVPMARPRALDYLELTKPRIAVLVLATVLTGVLAFLACSAWLRIEELRGLHALLRRRLRRAR